MAKTSLQDEAADMTIGCETYDVVILVDNQEHPDGEEVKYDLQQFCRELGKTVQFKIMNTMEISDGGSSFLQAVVDEGKLVVPIFTERFVSERKSLNILYAIIINSMKQRGNANFFKPVFFENPKKARFLPTQFCNFKSFWWERERDREALVKILCL